MTSIAVFLQNNLILSKLYFMIGKFSALICSSHFWLYIWMWYTRAITLAMIQKLKPGKRCWAMLLSPWAKFTTACRWMSLSLLLCPQCPCYMEKTTYWLNSVGLILFWQESSSCKNFINGTSLGHLELGCQAFVLNGWKDVMEKSFNVGIFPKKRLITVLILDFPMGLNFIAAHDRAWRMQEEVLLLLFCSYWLSSQNFVVLWL